MVISWVLCYESAPASMRTYVPMVSGAFTTLGYTALAPLAYYSASWRQLYVLTSLPSLAFSVLAYLYVLSA